MGYFVSYRRGKTIGENKVSPSTNGVYEDLKDESDIVGVPVDINGDMLGAFLPDTARWRMFLQ